MNLSKSLTRRALLAAASILLPLHAGAQAPWPSKPIKLIVPFEPGASNDNIARLLATKLQARLDRPIIVENKVGAGGTIGTAFVARAKPDGYTLLFASSSITTNVASGKTLEYDPVKDLEPIGKVAATPFVIVVSNDVKATTLNEFIALARAKPNSINYGSAGIGGINHLGTEMFASAAKVQLVHVPYPGISPAFTDLMAGRLQMLLPSLASFMPQIHGGKMRALAVTSAQRSPIAPEIPTAAEAGLPGFQLEAWFGLVGPARLPAPIVKQLNEELNVVLAQPDVKALLAREGITPESSTPEQFGDLIRSDLARWKRLIKDNHIQTK